MYIEKFPECISSYFTLTNYLFIKPNFTLVIQFMNMQLHVQVQHKNKTHLKKASQQQHDTSPK